MSDCEGQARRLLDPAKECYRVADVVAVGVERGSYLRPAEAMKLGCRNGGALADSTLPVNSVSSQT